MLSPRWRKVVRDLWSNKLRTLLVVQSIAIGVFSIGMLVGSHAIVSRDMHASYISINPASAILTTAPFDDTMLQVVRKMPGVRAAEGRRMVRVRLNVGPETWRDMYLFVIADYNDIRINTIQPEQGAWPPPRKALLIERSALDLVPARVGGDLLIEMSDGTKRSIALAGLARDIAQFPSRLSGVAYGYISLDTLEWLGEPRSFNQLLITVAEHDLDQEHIRMVAQSVQRKIEKSGREVFSVQVPEPGKHPFEPYMKPLALMTDALGALSLLMSSFLVANTLSALLLQQVRQIGVMKAIGARSSQVIGLYLGVTLIFSVLALGIAAPLALIGTQLNARYSASLVNFDITNLDIPPYVFALEIGAGLLVPLLAALWPILAGTRITVSAAIGGYGMGGQKAGPGWLDRVLSQIHGLSRPFLLALRNTVRRKGRLALVLSTLILGSAVFVAVFSVRASLLNTLDEGLRDRSYDIGVTFSQPYRRQLIEQAATIPGVVKVESWGLGSARRLRDDDSESATIRLIAPPAATELIRSQILQGRWLLPNDQNALVVNNDVLKDQADIRVGSEIVLKIDGRKTTWQVVGIIQGVLEGPQAYANYPAFAQAVRQANQASAVQVVTASHDRASQAQLGQALEAHLKEAGLRVDTITTIADERSQGQARFDIIVISLSIMALMLASVGGLGLMGTMSINVLERTREIGVMRAIGASGLTILRIVIGEGVLIGAMSWMLGVLLGLPLSHLLSEAIGRALLDAPLSYTFATHSALLWLGVVLGLAALASFIPAWTAARQTVHSALAYEG